MPRDEEWSENVTRVKLSVPTPAGALVEFSRLEVRVEVVAGKPSTAVMAIEQDVFRIGSNAANDLVLDDPTVSRFHCRIRRDGGGWKIGDSGSRNGTRLGTINILEAHLDSETSSRWGSLAFGFVRSQARGRASTTRAPSAAWWARVSG